MTGREIIKAVMEKVGTSNATLAHRLHVAPNVMWARLNDKKIKDIPLTTMNDMIRALDYKILVVPASCKCPKDGYEVDLPRSVEQ